MVSPREHCELCGRLRSVRNLNRFETEGSEGPVVVWNCKDEEECQEAQIRDERREASDQE